MDDQVIAAMAKWPDVPAVYGWLSLTETGQWRLHPQGDALQRLDSAGEDITSPQILAFMDRNYDADSHGQWYFQNGPQRVYVRLDAAPLIVHTTTDPASGALKLRTHTGLDVQEILALYLDETGRLYAATDRGPALLAGRDLPSVLDALELDAADAAPDDPTDLAELLADGLAPQQTLSVTSRLIQGFPPSSITLQYCPQDELEEALGFRRHPAL